MYSLKILSCPSYCYADTSEYFLQGQRLKRSHSSIGLTVVHHNSDDLFHLQAAGHFSFQKHCRFQLISSASDRLEVVPSFESQIQFINQFSVDLLSIPSLHYSAEIGLHGPGSLKEQFWTLLGSLKAPGSLKVLRSLKVPYRALGPVTISLRFYLLFTRTR